MENYIQVLFSYVGIALFCGGLFFCFFAKTFRYGVFCSLVGNLCFVLAIVMPYFFTKFVKNIELEEYIKNADISLLHHKGIIIGIILMGIFWGIKWFKDMILESLLIFLFPKVIKINAKSDTY
ncbi:MAG: hypothetical protein ACI4V7_01135 [Succinivibrionaceae bacterium]